MNLFFSPGMITAWVIGAWLVTAVVHVGFAFAVLADTGMMQRNQRREPFLVGGVIWALATLLGGVFVAAIYWLIHHSTLRPVPRADAPSPSAGPTPGAPR